jgi:hypothetical protein
MPVRLTDWGARHGNEAYRPKLGATKKRERQVIVIFHGRSDKNRRLHPGKTYVFDVAFAIFLFSVSAAYSLAQLPTS